MLLNNKIKNYPILKRLFLLVFHFNLLVSAIKSLILVNFKPIK